MFKNKYLVATMMVVFFAGTIAWVPVSGENWSLVDPPPEFKDVYIIKNTGAWNNSINVSIGNQLFFSRSNWNGSTNFGVAYIPGWNMSINGSDYEAFWIPIPAQSGGLHNSFIGPLGNDTHYFLASISSVNNFTYQLYNQSLNMTYSSKGNSTIILNHTTWINVDCTCKWSVNTITFNASHSQIPKTNVSTSSLPFTTTIPKENLTIISDNLIELPEGVFEILVIGGTAGGGIVLVLIRRK